MKRIAVTGPAGAGKSRLARELGFAHQIEVLHLDTMFWKPGWVPTAPDEWEAIQRRELTAASWIVDAQYDDMLPDWLEQADTVVFVDVSPLRCLWRVSRRRLDRHGSAGIPDGTEPGALHRALLKFLRNQWRYRTTIRRMLLAELARERAGRRVVVVRRPGDSEALVHSLDSASAAGGTL